ncbi:MAG: ParA family protein [Methylococcales bacterium]
MKVWTVSNQKGGVGKTTTVVTLGGLLSDWGLKVLLVDLDPHGSLTSYFRINPEQAGGSAYNLFQDAMEGKAPQTRSCIQPTAVNGLSVLPATTALASIERKGSGFEGMGLVISRALAGIDPDFDYVLIDSPPSLGVLMINGLAACNRLIVPVQTEFLAMKGLERMVATLQMIYKSRNRALDYTIVPTLFDRRTSASVQTLKALREQYPAHLWDSVIPIDTRLRDASQAGLPASICYPGSRAVVAYGALLDGLMRKERLDERQVAAG